MQRHYSLKKRVKYRDTASDFIIRFSLGKQYTKVPIVLVILKYIILFCIVKVSLLDMHILIYLVVITKVAFSAFYKFYKVMGGVGTFHKIRHQLMEIIQISLYQIINTTPLVALLFF